LNADFANTRSTKAVKKQGRSMFNAPPLNKRWNVS